jgi:hypothetical protein
MLTWTTYGTWLQRDKRGYVKKGATCPPNIRLKKANEQSQSQDSVLLSKAQQKVVRDAILKEAKSQGHHIRALAVNATHVHVAVEYADQPINKTVAYYEKAARLALKATDHAGKLWTRGYDKRFCFDRATLDQRIKYVERHEK